MNTIINICINHMHLSNKTGTTNGDLNNKCQLSNYFYKTVGNNNFSNQPKCIDIKVSFVSFNKDGINIIPHLDIIK